MKRFLRVVLLMGLLLAPFGVSAQTWVDYATVSMTNPTTPKLLNNRVCYSDGTDMACDGAAGLLSTSGSLVIGTVSTGGLSVSGNVSATNISVTALTVGGVAITGSGGASKLASLTDVDVSGKVSGSVLVYTGATTSWTALPIQTVMSTTTMVSGWPDAIKCNLTNPANGTEIFYAYVVPYPVTGKYYYSSYDGTTFHVLEYNANGTFSSYSNITTSDCNKTISQLYTDGQAYNFIGNSSAGGGTSSGDRIVSTSANVVAMAGGTVSITTGGTSGTAYFGSTGLLVAPGISATQNVSSFTTLYASGNVGIGTTAPAFPLDVSSTTGIRATTSGAGYAMLQPGSWAASGFTGFYASSTVRLGYVGWGVPNSTMSLMTDASTTSLSLGTSGTTQMLINGSGNVGIGTMAPNATLDVNGTVSATKVVVSASGTVTGISYKRTDGKDARIGVGDASQTWSIGVGWSNPGYFTLIQEGVAGDRLSVGVSGNVGVGVTSPTTKLEVAGGISATGGVQVGYNGNGCSSVISGTVRYNAGAMEFCNGTTWSAMGGKSADRQVFTSVGAGTWTKPSGFSTNAQAFIQCWGGGGGGAHGAGNSPVYTEGGGGGAYSERWILLSSLGATETVTVGAGGAGATTSNNAGSSGGNSTFGSWVTAYAGAGGTQVITCPGTTTASTYVGVLGVGYVGSPGGNGFCTGGGSQAGIGFAAPYMVSAYDDMSGNHIYNSQVVRHPWDGGSAGGGPGYPAGGVGILHAGGKAIWGGGGGGGYYYSSYTCNGSNAGGTSLYGGNGGGGSCSTNGVAGSQPGGGGGSAIGSYVAGAGGAGQCIVTVFN